MQRLRDDRERGATVVVVVIMMAALLGAVGLGVDGAAAYSKKQQMQNGADAAAFAVAQQYALTGCTEDDALAQQYAAANVIAEQPSVDAEVDCLATNKLRIDAWGDQSPYFMAALGAGPMSVGADATVEWGAPAAGPALLPFTMSACSYYDAFEGPAKIDQPFNHFFLTPSLHADGPCPYHGDYPPAGFNWLDPATGCSPYTSVGAWAPGDTGNNVPPGCNADYFNSLLGQRALIPIFDEKMGTGSSGAYRISGYAAIEFTGWYFNTLSGSPKGGGAACTGAPTGAKTCISGVFRGYVGLDEAFEISPPAPGDKVLLIRLTS